MNILAADNLITSLGSLTCNAQMQLSADIKPPAHVALAVAHNSEWKVTA